MCAELRAAQSAGWNEWFEMKTKYAVAVRARDHQIVNAFDPIEFKCDFCYCSHWLFSAPCARRAYMYECFVHCPFARFSQCDAVLSSAARLGQAQIRIRTNTFGHSSVGVCESRRATIELAFELPHARAYIAQCSSSLSLSHSLDSFVVGSRDDAPEWSFSVHAPSFTRRAAASSVGCASFSFGSIPCHSSSRERLDFENACNAGTLCLMLLMNFWFWLFFFFVLQTTPESRKPFAKLIFPNTQEGLSEMVHLYSKFR